MKTWKLFVSFTGLFNLLDSGKVTFQDLESDKALFYFGCARDHVMGKLLSEKEISEMSPEERVGKTYDSSVTANEWLFWFERSGRSLETRLIWVDLLQEIVLRAEKTGRVHWRNKEKIFQSPPPFLKTFGLWDDSMLDFNPHTWNNYPMMEEALANRDVDVLWRV